MFVSVEFKERAAAIMCRELDIIKSCTCEFHLQQR